MKAIIQNVEFKGEFDSQYGKLYGFLISYDGKTAYYNSKSQDQTKFTKGQEAEFEESHKTDKNGNPFITIKPIQTQFNPNSKKGVSIAGFAVSYAKDLIIAGKSELNELEILSERIFNLLKKLEN